MPRIVGVDASGEDETMRLMAGAACWLIAFDCASRAVGNEPSKIFTPDAVWLWWIFAFLWGVGGMRVILNGVR